MSEIDDPVLNCLLEVCCQPGSAQQLARMSVVLAAGVGCTPDEAKPYAAWFLNNFDLAEKGTLGAFKNSVARLARGNPHQA